MFVGRNPLRSALSPTPAIITAAAFSYTKTSISRKTPLRLDFIRFSQIIYLDSPNTTVLYSYMQFLILQPGQSLSRGEVILEMLYYPHAEEGQGLVEYALILVLVAVTVMIILAILGPAIGNIFSNIISTL
jgi:pilus assembly protein Flp/PilA